MLIIILFTLFISMLAYLSSYENFTIHPNQFLKQSIRAYYHTDYVGYLKPGNPDYINTLKNTYNSYSATMLNSAVQELKSVLFEDLPQILQILQLNLITICVVPRAKTNYQSNQLLFKKTIKDIINQIIGLSDGIDYIVRHTVTTQVG